MIDQMTTLGESCDFFNGKAHEKDIDAEGAFIVVNSKFISKDGNVKKFSNQQMFPLFEDDIVMVMSDVPNGKALAKCYIIEENDKYSLNQRICAIRTNEFNIHFLYYQLNRHPYLLEFNNGENQTNLRKDDILTCPLWKPSLEVQDELVELLDVTLLQIDQAKTNIEKNITNAKELFQSKLNEIFSQRGEGWEEKTLIEVSKEFGRGKSKHRPRNDLKLYNGIYPFVQTGDVRNTDKFITEFSQTYNEIGLSQSKLWKKGTICITIAANIAESAILNFDGCFPDSIIGFVVDPKKANRDFAYYCLLYLKTELQKQGKGSAQDNINLGTFQNQKFPFPQLKRQIEIVYLLDKLQIETFDIEKTYISKLVELEELKKSILQKAFSGELTQKEVAV